MPISFSSCSPNRVRCLVALTAACGAHGFSPTLHQILRRTMPSSEYPTCTRPVTTVAANTAAVAALSAFSRDRRRFHDGGTIAHGSNSSSTSIESSESSCDETEHVTAAAVERPWLGNGADPMAEVRKNLPSSLEAAEAGAEGGKGKGVPAEEMWLNGPFKAPLPPRPVISPRVLARFGDAIASMMALRHANTSLVVRSQSEDMLYVDDDIVVVNKPSGLLCVPGRVEKDSLASRTALELGHYRVDRMIVHRLDMATSGVVVMARSDAALKDLNRQFRQRQVRKRYVAMVHGVVSADEGEVDLPLCRNAGCPPLHMVNMEQGKPSLTQWRVVERAADRTRVELIPVSGRSHQLRLHMDAIGHPILGDHFYGTKDSLDLADRCLLHAQTLCLRHPITGERRMFTAPCEF